ncbi:MAG TPA: phenylalanine--tRNA ligase subunit beta [Phycisphaerae bacterium]|nr:phenylalanine--tRNA ligase subunit beta [Phycisphaerae bacterium]
MNVSYNWLKDYVETGLGYVEAAKRLTEIGLNVDSIEDLADGDGRLEVEVTSNRPDCLGHIGVARELAAAIDATVRLPETAFDESDENAADLVAVEVADLDLCPLYTARVVCGVTVRPSPDWLVRRLEAVGVRPVNNIVDVTNYVLMECGQPLHAFDFAGIRGRRIVVRRAKAGEEFHAIDHTRHTLTPDRLVIADAQRPVALAGVMGGADTEIADTTADVLLEAAVFDPLSIRNTSRALAMMSDSSYRFERRVDPHMTDWASRRACRLIVEVAGGRVAKGVVTVGRPLPEPVELTLRVPRIETLLGLAVPADTAARILARLQCQVIEADGRRIRVRVPSWRPDLAREVDLIEEVARHYGYDKIPESRATPLAISAPTKAERVREVVGHVLTAAGYFEAITFTFTTRDHAVRFRPSDVTAEPLTCRGTALALRESLLAGVAESLRVNRGAGEATARLFEIAKRFIPLQGQELPQEEQMLALAGPGDFAEVRGVLEAVFAALRIERRVTFAATDRYADLEPGAAADILLDAAPIGMIGRASAQAAAAFDLDDPPTVAEVRYETLVEAADLAPTAQPLPQFPAITRDLAVVLDEATAWADVARAIRGAGVAELESLEPLDVYRGKQVPAGKKSVALRLVFRTPRGTLTHEQADGMQGSILAALTESMGAVLRG